MKFCLLLLASLPALAQNLKEFEKKVTEFTLANGLHFVVIERHEAPVVSFNTFVKAGSLNDPNGQTGLAHMFEHMAFKGTPWIGSKNWPEEKKALDEVEQIYARLEEERRKDLRANRERINSLENQLKAAIDKANLYVEPNAYPRIVEENGGVGMNAGTNLESTNYYYNFPANRIELLKIAELVCHNEVIRLLSVGEHLSNRAECHTVRWQREIVRREVGKFFTGSPAFHEVAQHRSFAAR